MLLHGFLKGESHAGELLFPPHRLPLPNFHVQEKDLFFLALLAHGTWVKREFLVFGMCFSAQAS